MPSVSNWKLGTISLQIKNTSESFTHLLETKDVIPPVIWIMLRVEFLLF